MIFYKTDEEIELIRESCHLVCKTLAYVGSLIKPGVQSIELDKSAEIFIRDHKGVPAFKGYKGFPASLCISINEQVVHGIPTSKELKDTDVVSVDCGVLLNEYYGDAAYTFALSKVGEKEMELLSATLESLYLGIAQAIVGKRVGDIGFAVQDFAERKHRYGVVRELVGHGIGKSLHEEPDVPNFGKRGNGLKLMDGLVIAIEPMINLGVKEVKQLEDGWTIISADKKTSAHFEHTVAVRKHKADILSDHSYIEETIKNNQELQNISRKS